MRTTTSADLARVLTLIVALLAAGGCGQVDRSGHLSGFEPGLPFGIDAADDGQDTAAKDTAALDTAPDTPPAACTADLDCDDDLPCTADFCGDDGLCHHGMKAGRCLIDGVCIDGQTAQWGNACKACQPAISPVAWTPVATGACDDGDPCTAGDTCHDGACVPGENLARRSLGEGGCDDGDPCSVDTCEPGVGCRHEGSCACAIDADCDALDDGNLCNGRLRCDTSAATPACVLDPASVITCDTSNDTACQKTMCLPGTGACVTGTAQEGLACDDGDGCTVADACVAGACKGDPCEAVGQLCRQGACVTPACGDGWLDPPAEACDDKNDQNGDGCSKNCKVENGFSCVGQPSVCSSGEVHAYAFDTNDATFSGTDGWESQYCSDPWTTTLNGGVFPTTDDGCAIPEDQCFGGNVCGWDFGYWVQMGNCINSDPFDNHLTWGDKTWSDYSFGVSFKNDDDDSLGVVFRYTNSGQFYLLYFAHDQAPHEATGCNMTYSGARLVRVVNQQPTLLAKSDVTYQVGQVHRLRVDVTGAHVTAVFDKDADGDLADEAPLFDLVDNQPLLQGKVGLYAYENGATGDSFDPCSAGGCWFDDVMVVVH